MSWSIVGVVGGGLLGNVLGGVLGGGDKKKTKVRWVDQSPWYAQGLMRSIYGDPQFSKDITNYVKTPVPHTEGFDYTMEELIPQLPSLIGGAIGSQQELIPGATQAVKDALGGNFFDIGPMQDYAERQLYRNTIPAIAQTFATADVADSSDLTGQIASAARDTYMGLGAQDAMMEYGAKNALINQGGLGNFFDALQQPANLGMSGSQGLLNLDMLGRSVYQSGLPGASTLFPSSIEGGLSNLANIEQGGRVYVKQSE